MSDVLEEEDFTTKVNTRVVVRMFGLVRPHWRWVAGFIVLIATTSVLDSYFTYLGKLIIDDAISVGDASMLSRLLLRYGGMAVLQAATVCGFILLASFLGERVQYDLRRKLFRHLQELSFSYFDRTPVGWIMSRVTSDSERIAELVTWGLVDITWAVLNITTSIIFMISINWQLSLLVLGVIPIMMALAFWFRQRILFQYREVRRLNSLITGAYNENITGVRVVKALVREKRNAEEFERRPGRCTTRPIARLGCRPSSFRLCRSLGPSVQGQWYGMVGSGSKWRV